MEQEGVEPPKFTNPLGPGRLGDCHAVDSHGYLNAFSYPSFLRPVQGVASGDHINRKELLDNSSPRLVSGCVYEPLPIDCQHKKHGSERNPISNPPGH